MFAPGLNYIWRLTMKTENKKMRFAGIAGRFLVLILFLSVYYPGNLYPGERVFINLGRERLAFENELEKKAETQLRKRFDMENVAVQVSAVPYMDASEIEEEGTRRYALPGVPVAEEIMSESEAPEIRYFLRRLDTRVYLSENVDDDTVSDVRSFLTELLNVDYDRGDRLDIERALAPPGGFDYSALIRPPYLFYSAGLLFLFLFLMGPVGSYLRQARKNIEITSIRERSTSAVPGGAAVEGAGYKNQDGSDKNTGSKEGYFSFVNSGNLSRLLQALRDENAESAAVVCEFLPAELSGEVLSGIPYHKRKDAIKFMSRVNYLSAEKIKEIESRIKEKVQNIVGGDESLFKLFTELDIEEQREMVEAAEQENKKLAEKLREHIITFEDILDYDASDLISLMRINGAALFARALKGAEKESVSKLTKKLPSGSVKMLQEELSFLSDLDEKQVFDARKKIIKSAYKGRKMR